ncbi:hypothetical protein [Microbacterium sp.]|uniref:hypothetical protein n=1 Tax=Microbacterium sp. TaxID=51671 RepID=UPI0028112ABE|nr:hypothetical protein [Microbacterium sp.]
MSTSSERIDDYLARYAATLTDLDAEAGSALWSVPGMIADDRASLVVESREAMAEGVKQSYPLYQQLGLASVEHELLEIEELSDRLVLVRVRWLFLDDRADLLTDTFSYYLLREEEDDLRAVVCVETDAAEKLQALADERGVELPPSS